MGVAVTITVHVVPGRAGPRPDQGVQARRGRSPARGLIGERRLSPGGEQDQQAQDTESARQSRHAAFLPAGWMMILAPARPAHAPPGAPLPGAAPRGKSSSYPTAAPSWVA